MRGREKRPNRILCKPVVYRDIEAPGRWTWHINCTLWKPDGRQARIGVGECRVWEFNPYWGQTSRRSQKEAQVDADAAVLAHYEYWQREYGYERYDRG